MSAPYNVSWIRADPIDWEAGGFGFGNAKGDGLWDNLTIELDVLLHNSEGAHIEVDAYDRATAIITDGGIGASWEKRLSGLLEDAGLSGKTPEQALNDGDFGRLRLMLGQMKDGVFADIEWPEPQGGTA